MMLAALSTYHGGMPQIAIVGSQDGEDTRALQHVLHITYLPTSIVIPVFPQHRESIVRLLPWIESMRAIDGRATAYVCRDFACQAPATSPAQLGFQLMPS